MLTWDLKNGSLSLNTANNRYVQRDILVILKVPLTFHLDLTDKQNSFLFPVFHFHPPLSLLLQRFVCMWFCSLIIYIKTTHVFYSFLFPAHYFPHMSRSNSHTDAQMSNAGGTFLLFFSKCLRKIRNDESPRAQTKENVALLEWELFGPGKNKK